MTTSVHPTPGDRTPKPCTTQPFPQVLTRLSLLRALTLQCHFPREATASGMDGWSDVQRMRRRTGGGVWVQKESQIAE